MPAARSALRSPGVTLPPWKGPPSEGSPLCVRRRVQLQWPKAITEAKRMQESNAGALRDWLAGTAPAVLRGLNARIAVQVPPRV